ncbi:hypothetical protein D3C80_1684700 [compost metagenome]
MFSILDFWALSVASGSDCCDCCGESELLVAPSFVLSELPHADKSNVKISSRLIACNFSNDFIDFSPFYYSMSRSRI